MPSCSPSPPPRPLSVPLSLRSLIIVTQSLVKDMFNETPLYKGNALRCVGSGGSQADRQTAAGLGCEAAAEVVGSPQPPASSPPLLNPVTHPLSPSYLSAAACLPSACLQRAGRHRGPLHAGAAGALLQADDLGQGLVRGERGCVRAEQSGAVWCLIRWRLLTTRFARPSADSLLPSACSAHHLPPAHEQAGGCGHHRPLGQRGQHRPHQQGCVQRGSV